MTHFVLRPLIVLLTVLKLEDLEPKTGELYLVFVLLAASSALTGLFLVVYSNLSINNQYTQIRFKTDNMFL